MKIFHSETVMINGKSYILNSVEMPKDGDLKLPQFALGLHIGPDGHLYYPVNALNKSFIGNGDLRDFIWHAIRNVQRNLTDDNVSESIILTRKYNQLHDMLLGQYAYDDEMAKGLCRVEKLDILLEILKEEQEPYKANGNDTVMINGAPVDRQDLITSLSEAGNWFIWEADQPEQWFRQGWLLKDAVAALNAAYDLQGLTKEETALQITKKLNVDHPDDLIPVEFVLAMMEHKEIQVTQNVKLKQEVL